MIKIRLRFFTHDGEEVDSFIAYGSGQSIMIPALSRRFAPGDIRQVPSAYAEVTVVEEDLPGDIAATAGEEKAVDENRELTAAEHEHLRHMTDGHWHDACSWCLERRAHGGTGIAWYDRQWAAEEADR